MGLAFDRMREISTQIWGLSEEELKDVRHFLKELNQAKNECSKIQEQHLHQID